MDANLYKPPQGRLAKVEWPDALPAARWRRLVAALIDACVLSLAWSGLGWGIGALTGWTLEGATMSWDGTTLGVSRGFGDIGHTLDYLMGATVFLALQGVLLYRRQQTIGKLVVGVRIADIHGRPASFGRIVLRRELPLWLLAWVPFGVAIYLLDLLFIFLDERRCLHDLVAGTCVVRAR